MTPIFSKRVKWCVFFACSSSLAMIFADQSALPVALASIQRELHMSALELQWVVNSYLLTLAVFIILGGKLGDRYGHRKLFLTGIILFIASSIGCALSPNGSSLIISRAVQGVGGALMIPSASPIFRHVFGQRDFGKMVGLYLAFASIFMMLGPTLGGFLTAYLSWRWIFWINFPLAMVAIIITLFIMPHDDENRDLNKGFDWAGFILLSVSLCAGVFALMQGNSLGWLSPLVVGCFLLTAVCLVWFIRVERRQNTPFVELALLNDRVFSGCVWMILLLQIAYISLIFWPLFLEYVLQLPPQKVGILLLAVQVPVFFVAPIAGRLLDRFGPYLPVRCGSLLMLMGSLWIATLAHHDTFAWLMPGLILFGIGSPMATMCVMSTVGALARPEKRGTASGLISASRQIGSVLGLAMLSTLMLGLNHYYLLRWLGKTSGKLAELHLSQLDALLTNTAPAATAMALTAQQQQVAHEAAARAYTFGFSGLMLIAALALLIVFFLAKRLPRQSLNPSTP